MIETLTEAEKKLKAFAEQEPKIIALYKGKDFEEGTELYYFLAPGQMDPALEDRLTDLDLGIFKNLGVSVSVTIWPSNKPENYGLKEDNCLYRQ